MPLPAYVRGLYPGGFSDIRDVIRKSGVPVSFPSFTLILFSSSCSSCTGPRIHFYSSLYYRNSISIIFFIFLALWGIWSFSLCTFLCMYGFFLSCSFFTFLSAYGLCFLPPHIQCVGSSLPFPNSSSICTGLHVPFLPFFSGIKFQSSPHISFCIGFCFLASLYILLCVRLLFPWLSFLFSFHISLCIELMFPFLSSHSFLYRASSLHSHLCIELMFPFLSSHSFLYRASSLHSHLCMELMFPFLSSHSSLY